MKLIEHDKERWFMVPLNELIGASRVMTLGAVKHDPFGWKTIPHA